MNEGDDDLERRLRDVLHDRGLSITPGHDALDRVHAGARRRQQRRVVASGSVAVALVAVVGSALALRPHNPRPVVADNQHALTSSSPATTPPSALLSAPASEVASSAPAVAPSISASDSPNAPSVFNPVSVTAVSADAFWVLGYTTTTSTDGYGIATSIRRTTDGGQHFTTVGAPDMLVAQAPMSRPPGAPTVSDIRFGDPNDGWAYGRALYATADGGTSWSQVTEIAGGVVDLVAANGVAWAVVDLSSGSPSPAGRTHYALYSTGYGHGRQQWKPVQLPIELGDTQPSIVDQDGTVTVLASGPLRTGYVGHALVASPGGPFVDHTGPCYQDMGGHLSNSKNAIWAVCPTGHAAGLQISTDRGATWTPYTLSQPFPDPGTGIAAIDGQHAVVIDTATGLLLRLTTTKPSVPARIPAADVVASFVGFTDPIHGFALVGIQNAASSQAATELWRTTDGGTTWVVVKISP